MTGERGYPWLKVYVALLDDPKYLRLSDGAKALYLELYLLAGRADAAGLVIIGEAIGTIEDLGFVLHRDVSTVSAALGELIKAGFLTESDGTFSIARFGEEQGPSREETRAAWRDRQSRRRKKLTGQDLEEKEDGEGDYILREEVTRESRVTFLGGEYEYLRHLGLVFVEGFGREPLSREVDQWHAELRELWEIGVTSEDLRDAFAQMNYASFNVRSPASLKTFAWEAHRARIPSS